MFVFAVFVYFVFVPKSTEFQVFYLKKQFRFFLRKHSADVRSQDSGSSNYHGGHEVLLLIASRLYGNNISNILDIVKTMCVASKLI